MGEQLYKIEWCDYASLPTFASDFDGVVDQLKDRFGSNWVLGGYSPRKADAGRTRAWNGRRMLAHISRYM